MDSVPYHSLLLVLIVIGLILVNGFFTALHTGVISLSQDKLRDLEEKGSKDAEVLLRITSNQDRLNQSFSMINSVLSLITVAFIADMIRDSEIIMDNISMKTALLITILFYIVAVSYTHLDVYKRQVLPLLNTTGTWAIT